MSEPRGRPFPPGNKLGRGRPKGSRNKSSATGQRLLEQHFDALIAMQLKAAYGGERKALQWCLEQTLRAPAPIRKLKLPPQLSTIEDLNQAANMILDATATGRRSVADGAAWMAMLEQCRKLIEDQELASRIERLEQQVRPREGG